jgi:hypothetical protein
MLSTRLAVSVSENEVRTNATRHLERHAAGSYHYPAIIQGHDGTLHAIYKLLHRVRGTGHRHAGRKAEGSAHRGQGDQTRGV